MATTADDEPERTPAVPELLPETPPEADILIGGDEVAVTVAIPGAEPDGVLVRVDVRHVVITNRPGYAPVHYRVHLPVLVDGTRPRVSVVNGVVDVTLLRTRPRAQARAKAL